MATIKYTKNNGSTAAIGRVEWLRENTNETWFVHYGDKPRYFCIKRDGAYDILCSVYRRQKGAYGLPHNVYRQIGKHPVVEYDPR